jgi:hypothetical protein
VFSFRNTVWGHRDVCYTKHRLRHFT